MVILINKPDPYHILHNKISYSAPYRLSSHPAASPVNHAAMIEVTTDFQRFQLHSPNGHYTVGDQEIHPEISRVGEFEWQVTVDNRTFSVLIHHIDEENKLVSLTIDGKPTTVKIRTRAEQLLQKLGLAAQMKPKAGTVKAPMPGLIHSIRTSVGESVKKGDPLLILEAMKMENVIKSPGDGVIARIHVNEKDSVEKNALLVSFG